MKKDRKPLILLRGKFSKKRMKENQTLANVEALKKMMTFQTTQFISAIRIITRILRRLQVIMTVHKQASNKCNPKWIETLLSKTQI